MIPNDDGSGIAFETDVTGTNDIVISGPIDNHALPTNALDGLDVDYYIYDPAESVNQWELAHGIFNFGAGTVTRTASNVDIGSAGKGSLTNFTGGGNKRVHFTESARSKLRNYPRLMGALGTSGAVSLDFSRTGLTIYPDLSASGALTLSALAGGVEGAKVAVRLYPNTFTISFGSGIYYGIDPDTLVSGEPGWLTLSGSSDPCMLIFSYIGGKIILETVPNMAYGVRTATLSAGAVTCNLAGHAEHHQITINASWNDASPLLLSNAPPGMFIFKIEATISGTQTIDLSGLPWIGGAQPILVTTDDGDVLILIVSIFNGTIIDVAGGNRA